jgi:hypothetical protein
MDFEAPFRTKEIYKNFRGFRNFPMKAFGTRIEFPQIV